MIKLEYSGRHRFDDNSTMMTGEKSVNASSDYLVNNLEYEVLKYDKVASDFAAKLV